MEAPPHDRKRKRKESAPDEVYKRMWENRGRGTKDMCVCHCGEEEEKEGEAEEPDDDDLRCCCTQCGPADVNSYTQRCTVRLTRVGAQVDRFMRLGRDFDATASVQIAERRLGLVFGSGEPFFCEDCKEANHARLKILKVKEAVATVKRARQERISQQLELRGSEPASASSRNVPSQ